MVENNNGLESIKYMDVVPECLLPSIDVEYVFTLGMSVGGGDIENVPEGAIGAIISQRYPYIDMCGNIALNFIEYSIFVGKTMEIDEALLKASGEADKMELSFLKDDAYEEVVIPLNAEDSIDEFVGYDSDVTVVSSREELVDRIAEINLMYKAMNPTFSYPENRGRSRKRTNNK